MLKLFMVLKSDQTNEKRKKNILGYETQEQYLW